MCAVSSLGHSMRRAARPQPSSTTLPIHAWLSTFRRTSPADGAMLAE